MNAPDDDALFELLSAELNARLKEVSRDMDALHAELLRLPRGLRAMGATHPLDVSMALDDLGWHFGNWPSQAIARETLSGLRELGATEAAEIFEAALGHAVQHWNFVCGEDFHDRYHESPLDWAPYARAHPNLVCTA